MWQPCPHPRGWHLLQFKIVRVWISFREICALGDFFQTFSIQMKLSIFKQMVHSVCTRKRKHHKQKRWYLPYCQVVSRSFVYMSAFGSCSMERAYVLYFAWWRFLFPSASMCCDFFFKARVWFHLFLCVYKDIIWCHVALCFFEVGARKSLNNIYKMSQNLTV